MLCRLLLNLAQGVSPGDRREPGDLPILAGIAGWLFSRTSTILSGAVVGLVVVLCVVGPMAMFPVAWGVEASPAGAERSAGAAVQLAQTAPQTPADQRRDLVVFGNDFDSSSMTTSDIQATLQGGLLRIETGTESRWPGVTFKAPTGAWDLGTFEAVVAEIKNVGEVPLRVGCRVDNPGADGRRHCITAAATLAPGQAQALRVVLRRRMPEQLRDKLFGMRGFPGAWSPEGGIDPAQVNQVLVFVTQSGKPGVLELRSLHAEGRWTDQPPTDPDKLFPLIDRFGQYIHKEWPGKIHNEQEFTERRQREEADLAAHPGPQDWDTYGGWAAGPKLKATGRFRVEKHEGKWWLVDPEGRLFWSHGTDCVRFTTAYTPITDREHYFAWLPERKEPWAQFYGAASWAPRGYYHDRGRYETFNFTGANLLRKYGPEWREVATRLAHRRLRSWGLNTVANWSDPQIYLLRNTPYTATTGPDCRPIEGSQGFWGRFPDPFDPAFAESLRRKLRRDHARSLGDPWCIGFFVNNELSWGDETSLAVAALASPPDQPAKQEFLAVLRKKYGTIEQLNQAWGTEHESWDALLVSCEAPEVDKAREDLAEFYTRIAEQYFRICRQAIKDLDPDALYLGCRFAWVNDRAARAAARYCDVVSFNRYRRSVADLTLPDGIDRPVIIGEFHLGALDRGMFHTGLVPVTDQQQRGAAYVEYVESALRNPLIVGTHWFQYGDQATTGRGDGENYQIGMLDVCDTPYWETIAGVRKVGYHIYTLRGKR